MSKNLFRQLVRELTASSKTDPRSNYLMGLLPDTHAPGMPGTFSPLPTSKESAI